MSPSIGHFVSCVSLNFIVREYMGLYIYIYGTLHATCVININRHAPFLGPLQTLGVEHDQP